jgi:Tfp pilus assembly protein PilV
MRIALHRRPSAQRGVSLIEALIGFVVVALGALSAARLQHDLRLGADLTHQRGDAVRFAQQDIERLRGSESAGMTAAQRVETADHARFSIERRLDADAAAGLKSATLMVTWTDTGGRPQDLSLASMITGAPDALAAALTLRRPDMPYARLRGRAPSIPLLAKDLGQGRSVWKPTAAASVAYLFDNASGRIVSTCDGLPTDRPTQRLEEADLRGCNEAHASLLSGSVRASLATPPDAGHAVDPLPAFTLALTLGTRSSASCSTEAQKIVTIVSAGATRQQAVPAAAEPIDLGLAAWTDSGERFVAYHCVVTTGAGGWSGRSRLVPDGWTLGTRPADRKVCRFSADQDGSGAVDSNAEHPADYVNVTGSLMQQNFLLIAGDQACPGAVPRKLDGPGALAYVDLSTVQHQP